MNSHALECSGLTKSFFDSGNEISVANDLSFTVDPGEFVSVLGPSGSGKSSLLRMIAGLETPDKGSIEIAGNVVSCVETGVHLDPASRGVGMVFQSYAIWPHMTVRQNVEFTAESVQKNRGWTKTQTQERIDEALSTVELESHAQHRASNISGGQKQRLALARALVSEPKLILLDEPFSSLDSALRSSLRRELAAIQKRLGLAFVFVTHDQADALSLSDRIVILDDGNFQQIGTPRQIYLKPANEFVARFIGDGTIVTGELAREIDPSASKLLIRSEGVTLARSEGFEGTVSSIEYFGSHSVARVRIADSNFNLRVGTEAAITVGTPVKLEFASDHIVKLE